MYVCNGICNRSRVKKPVARISRYLSGQKLCNICETYMIHSGPRCPCCGCKLRSNPRSGKLRREFQKQKRLATLKTQRSIKVDTVKLIETKI